MAIASPAVAKKQKFTPEQSAWLAAKERQPLSFVVPKERIEEAWALAQEFIATVDPVRMLPVQSVTETLIQTSRAAKDTDALIFANIVRAPSGEDAFRVTVTFASTNLFLSTRATAYAKACAYTMASGVRYPE